MKQCKECKKFLYELEFYKVRKDGNKLQPYCKECAKKKAREYKQRMRDLVGRWKRMKGCQVCGFRAEHSCQLDLDHIDPSTKAYKGSHKSYDAGWSKDRIKKELAKCIVTCKNCHALRTYKEKHWKNYHTSIRMR